MQYVHLAGADFHISRVTFGCWSIGGHGYGSVDDEESIAAIKQSLARGVTFFDTADVYGFGHSERIVGRALKGVPQRVHIATKVGIRWDQFGRTRRDCSPTYVTEAVDASLRRLQVECIDLCQVHWPDPGTPIADTLCALTRCQERGKIAHIGCCNFSTEQVKTALRHARIVSLQVPYNLIDRRIEQMVIPLCTRLSVAVLTYSPLGQGFLSGQYLPDARFEPDDIRDRSVYFREELYPSHVELLRRLRVVAARYRRTPAQVALNWVLQNGHIASALVGIKTPAQAVENTELDWTLSTDDSEWLLAAHPGVPGAENAPRHAPGPAPRHAPARS